MNLTKAFFLCAPALLLAPVLACSQSADPGAAGAQPLTGNFDVFPDSTNYDEDRRVLDTDALGLDPETGRQEFVIWAMDEDSGGPEAGCGPIKTVVSRNGIEISKTGAYLADDGFDFF